MSAEGSVRHKISELLLKTNRTEVPKRNPRGAVQA